MKVEIIKSGVYINGTHCGGFVDGIWYVGTFIPILIPIQVDESIEDVIKRKVERALLETYSLSSNIAFWHGCVKYDPARGTVGKLTIFGYEVNYQFSLEEEYINSVVGMEVMDQLISALNMPIVNNKSANKKY